MPVTLLVRRRVEGALDRHKNPIITWSAPEFWSVRGLAPGPSQDPTQPNRDASLVEWTIYADASDDVPGNRDRVVVDGKDYEVAAVPQDWTRGPWTHPTAGVVVELKRWEG